MQRKIIYAGVLAILFCAVSLYAHDYYKFAGSITEFDGSWITVKDKDDKVFRMILTDSTEVWRDNQKLSPSELKVGLSVMVDAYGEGELDLDALSITILPPPKL
jgi:hypothetical protein